MINITHVYAEVLAWFTVKNGSWGGQLAWFSSLMWQQ